MTRLRFRQANHCFFCGVFPTVTGLEAFPALQSNYTNRPSVCKYENIESLLLSILKFIIISNNTTLFMNSSSLTGYFLKISTSFAKFSLIFKEENIRGSNRYQNLVLPSKPSQDLHDGSRQACRFVATRRNGKSETSGRKRCH
mgnify:CR=1 FL=1